MSDNQKIGLRTILVIAALVLGLLACFGAGLGSLPETPLAVVFLALSLII